MARYVWAVASAHLGQDGVFILDPVCLVNDDVAPVELLEVVLFLDDHLIGGDHDIKLARLQLHLLVHLQDRSPTTVTRLLVPSEGRGPHQASLAVTVTTAWAVLGVHPASLKSILQGSHTCEKR